MIKLSIEMIEELKKPIEMWYFVGIMDCIWLDNGLDPKEWRKGIVWKDELDKR